jgi:hypothetical protein
MTALGACERGADLHVADHVTEQLPRCLCELLHFCAEQLVHIQLHQRRAVQLQQSPTLLEHDLGEVLGLGKIAAHGD